jgi:hypothetical protein
MNILKQLEDKVISVGDYAKEKDITVQYVYDLARLGKIDICEFYDRKYVVINDKSSH